MTARTIRPLRARLDHLPTRAISRPVDVYGCAPRNERDFCPNCGVSFSVGLPFYTRKEKETIRAHIWNGWRLAAIGAPS